jgi:hypothetical protein
MQLDESLRLLSLGFTSLTPPAYGVVIFVAVCYHPPCPVYPVTSFVTQLSEGINFINSTHSHFILTVAGDFNNSCTDFLLNSHGMFQLVDVPTHGSNVLDKFFVNRPDLYGASVFRSLVKTKHITIVVEPLTASCINRPSDTRRRVLLHDTRAHNINRLRYEFATFNWSTIMRFTPIDDVYNNFLTVVNGSLKHPRYFRIGPKDSSFVTPLIKSAYSPKQVEAQRRNKRSQ